VPSNYGNILVEIT